MMMVNALEILQILSCWPVKGGLACLDGMAVIAKRL
jgi:hypothetical protein